MRIALDAMGGDFAPEQIVQGAVEAAKGIPGISALLLVGPEARLRDELAKHGPTPANIQLVHAGEVVGMDETPALAIRKKKDSSISRAVNLVAAGEADAVVSAGNTGAVMVAVTLKLRTLKGVERPAIATVMPTRTKPFILTDAGANTECTPSMLAQFAAMGSAYSKAILNVDKPIIGLLSVGGEDSKGNGITKRAFELIEASTLNFRGNIEGHDLFLGEIDVVVCDGFTGNVVLKTAEGLAHAITSWLKAEFMKNLWRKIGASMLLRVFKSLKRRMDPELSGGAPLLGVNGICIIAHGASSHRAVFHAVRVAAESVRHRLNERVLQEIEALKTAGSAR